MIMSWMKMTLTVRNQSVKRLPMDGRAHAILRCVRCGHRKPFYEEISSEYTQEIKKSFCKKCNSKEITLDLFFLGSEPIKVLVMASFH